MEAMTRVLAPPDPSFRVHATTLRVATSGPLEFLDLTDRVVEAVMRSGVGDGIVSVRTMHTTTAIVVNENEPMLLADLADALERWAPRDAPYRHDHPGLRPFPLGPAERLNGHAHARALLLGASESLHLADGRLQLGRWQRILFAEFDGPQERSVSVVVLGAAGAPSLPAGITGSRRGRP